MGGGRLLRTGIGSATLVAVMGAGLPAVTASAVTTAGTTAVSASASTGGVAHRAADRDLLGGVSSTRWFSPNGDRVQDKVRVGITVRRRSEVAVTVRRIGRGTVVRRASLGSLGRGERVWAWDGRNARGRVVRDGSYRVDVVAKRDRGAVRRDRAVTRVVLRTSYTPITYRGGEPRLELSRNTVHPTTRDFKDVVRIRVFQRLERRKPFGSTVSGPVVPAMEVRDATGKVVHEWRPSPGYGAVDRLWTGTTATGAPLPAGNYRLLVHFRDNYGNTGRSIRPLRVSAAPLVARSTWSATLTAAEALTSPPEWMKFCSRDCLPACSPSPSSRTAGALTLRSPEALRRAGSSCFYSEGTFAATVPFTLGVLDQLTVTLTGSEHPAGGGGNAYVGLSSAWTTTAGQTTPGTARTTVGPTFYGARSEDVPADQVRWYASAGSLRDTAEYDLETFEVEVVRYAPAR